MSVKQAVITFGQTGRSCGSCSLCCKLLPVKELGKPALQRCKHQRHSDKGCCTIYNQRPISCVYWSCMWWADPEATPNLSRPDRSHYVIDTMPDFVTVVADDGEELRLDVLQVWLDPAYPDAHKDPALREFLNENKVPALIRTGERKAFLLAPPSLTGAGWVENHSDVVDEEHTPEQIWGGEPRVISRDHGNHSHHRLGGDGDQRTIPHEETRQDQDGHS